MLTYILKISILASIINLTLLFEEVLFDNINKFSILNNSKFSNLRNLNGNNFAELEKSLDISNLNNLNTIISPVINIDKIITKNINIWGDYFTSPEIIIYFYNETISNRTIKIKNLNNYFVPANYINDVSAPVTITNNPGYLKLQILLTKEYIETSKCLHYQLKDFSFVSIKNCTLKILDVNDNEIVDFNLILLNMKIEQTNINQCLVEFSNKVEKYKEHFSSNYSIATYPNYLTEKIIYKECKQSFCKDLENQKKGETNKNNTNNFIELYDPIFGEYNFHLSFDNLQEYEFELFRAFLILRKEDYDIDSINKKNEDYEMVYYLNSSASNSTYYNNQHSNFQDTYNKQEGNSIAFFTDITKVLLTKGNIHQLNLDVFPEVFDLYLIFDVQRISFDANFNTGNSINNEKFSINGMDRSSFKFNALEEQNQIK